MSTIQTLAKQGKEKTHKGLADLGMAQLKRMRNEAMKSCFAQFNDSCNRMEFVARIHDKRFVNDAASRTINSTWYALDSIEGNIIWIANGTATPANYAMLMPSVASKVKMLICVGEQSQQLHDQFDGVVPMVIDVPTLKDAVHRALYNNVNTATVLFSPACENGVLIDEEGSSFKMEVNEL